MANIQLLSNKNAVLDKKAGFYPVQCSLVDKTGKNSGAVSLTLHISIYYISGRNWATEKQKDIVFLKKY